MPDKTTYEFAVIRIVPRVEREEFINAGVIVFSKRKRFLDMKFKIDEQRLLALDQEIDLELVREYLTAWHAICKGGKAGGPIGSMDTNYRYRWLTAYKNTIIQTSRPHPGICDDPANKLERLFEQFVN